MLIVCEGHPRIAGVSPGARFGARAPEVTESPVLVGDSFVDAFGCSIYGSVLHDEGRFRMWYQAWPRDGDGGDSLAVACAESDDGIDWRRPSYGLVDRGGSRDNHLTDLPFHAPSVFVDPEADAECRYRAFGYTDPPRAEGGRVPGDQRGYYTASSADGLRWTVEPGPLWPHADVITAAWDDGIGQARIAYKHNGLSAGQFRRRFYTSQWRAGAATPPVSAFVADEADDLAARARGCVSADYYGISWIPTAGPTLAAAWMFRHQPPLGHSPERGWTYGNRGQVDLALLYQTETGGRWMRLPGQPDWLAADDAPHWARGSLYAASHALDVGDETWLYFTGTPELHGWAGAGVELRAFRDRLTADGGFARIGRLSWPRHRLLGYTAGLTEWVHLTAVEESDAEPPGLRLNLVTSPRGRLRVALLDGDGNAVEGFGLDDCDGFAGDHLQRTITWRGSPQLPGREVAADLTARVEIEDGTLFAFSFGRS